MSDAVSETDVAAARACRDAVIAFVEQHESIQHNGEPCAECRVGLIAYLCHAIGVPNSSALNFFTEVTVELVAYNHQHERTHGPRSPAGHHHGEDSR